MEIRAMLKRGILTVRNRLMAEQPPPLPDHAAELLASAATRNEVSDRQRRIERSLEEMRIEAEVMARHVPPERRRR